MHVKVTIKKHSKMAKAVMEFMAEKQAWRKAVKEGKGKEYAQKNREKFATPV